MKNRIFGLALLLLFSAQAFSITLEAKVVDVFRNFYEGYPEEIKTHLKHDADGYFTEDVVKLMINKTKKVFYAIIDSDYYEDALSSLEDTVKVSGSMLNKKSNIIRVSGSVERVD